MSKLLPNQPPLRRHQHNHHRQPPLRYCQNFRLLHWDQDDLTTSWIMTTPTQEKRQLNSITRPSRPSKRNSIVRPTTWPSSLQASTTELAVLIGNISSWCQSTMVHQEHPDSLRTSVPLKHKNTCSDLRQHPYKRCLIQFPPYIVEN